MLNPFEVLAAEAANHAVHFVALFEKALGYYKKSMEQGTLDIRKMEYINIARCYEALKDKTNALEYYKKLEDEKSDSLIAGLVQDKINTLTND